MEKTQKANTETKASIETSMNQIIQHNLAAQKKRRDAAMGWFVNIL